MIEKPDEKWQERVQTARQHIAARDFDQAELMAMKALAIAETFAPDDYHQAISLELLSQIYFNNEKYYLGAPVLTRLMQLYKRRLGEHHIDTATIIQNLAILYHCWGELEEAKTYYQSAIEIREVVQGKNSPEAAQLRATYEKLLQSMNNKKHADTGSNATQATEEENRSKRREMRRRGLTSTNQFDSISMDDIAPSLS